MRKFFLSVALALMLATTAAVATAPSVSARAASQSDASGGTYAFLYGNPRGEYNKMSPKNTEKTEWNYTDEDMWAVVYHSGDYANLHPGNGGDAIWGWQSPGSGTATVTGSVQLLNPQLVGTDPAINGIRFSLLIRRKTSDGYAAAAPLGGEYDKALIDTARILDFSVTVSDIAVGDVILAAVNNNGNNNTDGNSVYFTVTYDGTEEDAAYDFGCAPAPIPSFSYKQGENGWYYAYGMPQRYILMDVGLNYAGYVWTGPRPYQFISDGYVHPAGRWNTLKIWVSSFDGEIEIDGKFVRASTEGDGTFVDVYHNGERIWWEQCDYIGNKTYRIEPMRRTVKKGDTIVFSFGTGTRYDNRADGLTVATDIYVVRGKLDPTVDTAVYLKAVDTEAKIVGVKGRTATPKTKSSNVGALIGGIAGGVAVAAGAAVLAVWLMKRRKRVCKNG